MAQTPIVTSRLTQPNRPETVGQRKSAFVEIAFTAADTYDNQEIDLDNAFKDLFGIFKVDQMIITAPPRVDVAQIPAGTQFVWQESDQTLHLLDNTGTDLADTVVLTKLVIHAQILTPPRRI